MLITYTTTVTEKIYWYYIQTIQTVLFCKQNLQNVELCNEMKDQRYVNSYKTQKDKEGFYFFKVNQNNK